MTTVSLFDEVVKLTEPYLGPAARRFVTRQIAFHLEKAPEDLQPGDVPELCRWVSATMSLLTGDQKLVQEYELSLLALGKH